MSIEEALSILKEAKHLFYTERDGKMIIENDKQYEEALAVIEKELGVSFPTKKKFGDMTVNEILRTCKKTKDCINCPFDGYNCYNDIFKNENLNQEIEVPKRVQNGKRKQPKNV